MALHFDVVRVMRGVFINVSLHGGSIELAIRPVFIARKVFDCKRSWRRPSDFRLNAQRILAHHTKEITWCDCQHNVQKTATERAKRNSNYLHVEETHVAPVLSPDKVWKSSV